MSVDAETAKRVADRGVSTFVAGAFGVKDFAKGQYWKWGRKTGNWWRVLFGVGVLAAVAYGLAGAVVLGILFAPFELLVSGIIGAAASAGMWLVGVPMGGWAAYRSRSEIKERKRGMQLSDTPSTSTVGEAVELLYSDDEEARAHAAFVVARVAASETPERVLNNSNRQVGALVDRLVDLLDEPDDRSRRFAADAVSTFSRDYTDAVVPHYDRIRQSLDDADADVRGECVIAVGNVGVLSGEYREDATEQAAGLRDDRSPDVRTASAVALVAMGTERSLALAREMLDDQNPEVRQFVNELLADAEQGAEIDSVERPEGERASDETPAETEFLQPAPDMDFSDVAGMAELKQRLQQDVLDPFLGDDVYEQYGVGADSGILLHGPPGTGKTHIAKAVAGELGVSHIAVDVGDIDSKYLGEGVENIKQLFAEARANQPCLVFIDEIDALAADRSASGQHEDKKKQVNQLLQELSEIGDDDDVLVIAATNHPDSVDEAMLRTGRFDTKIEVPKPDATARVEIFEHHMTAPCEPVDPDRLARATQGFVASDMAEVARRAARTAANRARESGEPGDVTAEDVYQAAESVGAERGSVGEFVQRPPELDFGDIAGMETLKQTLRERVIEPLENPEMFDEYGIGVQNGFLLYGPPGTGKTHATKCLAGELGVNYIEAQAGDLVSKWIGEGATNVQQMFEEARANQPCLVFIDEIDALATTRDTQQTKSEQQMVNQFLEELTAIDDADADVVVVGATNRPDRVDEAMLRSGRLGERIEVPPPDAAARVAIFEQHLDVPTDNVDDEVVAELTDGLVASDVEQLATDTARRAMNRARQSGDREPVTRDDLEAAVEART